MMRFTIIVLAFLLIIQALEAEHILVYAHEGENAGHKSLDYRRDQDISTLLPRKLRSGETTRTMVARAAGEEKVTAKILAAPKQKIGFQKRSKSSSFKWKPKKKKSPGEDKKTNILAAHDTIKHILSKKITIIVDDSSLPKLEPSTSDKDMKKLARLLRDDYQTRNKPRRKPPVNNRVPDKI